MLRVRIPILTAAALLSLPALGQTASLGERTPGEGLILPPESAATVDGASAGTLNPAGIGLMQGAQLEYWHERELLNAGGLNGDGLYGAATLFDYFAAGLSFEWLRPSEGANVTKTHLSIALTPDRAFSLGVAYNLFTSADPILGSLTSWDAGLLWRPLKYISFGASARDFDNPALAGTGAKVARRFDFGLGIRPLGPAFTLSADYLFLSDGTSGLIGEPPNGPSNGRLGLTAQLDLPFGLGIVAGAGIPVGSNTTTFGQLGVSVSTEHVGAALSYAPSTMNTPTDLGVFDVGLRLSKESFPTLPRVGVPLVEVNLAELLKKKNDDLLSIVSADSTDPYESVLQALKALEETSIRGVVFHLSELDDLSLGRIEELRDAIANLRSHGKFAVAYLGGGSDATYYLATACDKIYAVPETDFPLHGFAASSIYFAEGLSKLGIKVDVVRVGPYKSAPDALTRNEPSPEQTETTRRLLNDASDRYLQAATRARGLATEAFRAVLDRGLSTADDLLKAGLVDGILYPDELHKTLGKVLHGTVFTEALEVNPDRHQTTWSNLPGIAVVNVFGTITGGESQSGVLGFDHVAGAITIVRELRSAANDFGVSAVVVRVDSGGGDGAASELIWRAIAEVRKRKPVVVSFGDVAASGGYYLAVAADEILAEPSTITGSIGAFALKPDLSGLAAKLGVHPHEEALTPNADLFSLAVPWSDGERAVVQTYIDAFYGTFVKRVADGRKLTLEQVEAVGRGRVWSGNEAKERGLVDGFGSFVDAVDHAKARAHLDPRAEIRLVTYGEKTSLLNLGALGGALGLGQAQDPLATGLRSLIHETGTLPVLLLSNSRALALPEQLPAIR